MLWKFLNSVVSHYHFLLVELIQMILTKFHIIIVINKWQKIIKSTYRQNRIRDPTNYGTKLDHTLRSINTTFTKIELPNFLTTQHYTIYKFPQHPFHIGHVLGPTWKGKTLVMSLLECHSKLIIMLVWDWHGMLITSVLDWCESNWFRLTSLVLNRQGKCYMFILYISSSSISQTHVYSFSLSNRPKLFFSDRYAPFLSQTIISAYQSPYFSDHHDEA